MSSKIILMPPIPKEVLMPTPVNLVKCNNNCIIRFIIGFLGSEISMMPLKPGILVFLNKIYWCAVYS